MSKETRYRNVPYTFILYFRISDYERGSISRLILPVSNIKYLRRVTF
jgi:hypothetical protein